MHPVLSGSVNRTDTDIKTDSRDLNILLKAPNSETGFYNTSFITLTNASKSYQSLEF